VPFGEEHGELVVTIGRKLEEDEPFLGAFDLLVPPVGGRDRPGYLAAGREARRDSRPGQLHRLGPRVGGRLHLEVFALAAVAGVASRHAT